MWVCVFMQCVNWLEFDEMGDCDGFVVFVLYGCVVECFDSYCFVVCGCVQCYFIIVVEQVDDDFFGIVGKDVILVFVIVMIDWVVEC